MSRSTGDVIIDFSVAVDEADSETIDQFFCYEDSFHFYYEYHTRYDRLRTV